MRVPTFLAELLPWIVSAAGLLVGWLGRPRLPEAVGESLFVSGLSAAIVAGYFPGFADTEGFLRTCAILAGLAVLWHLVGRWIERPGAAGSAADRSAEIRRQLAGHFCLLCGIGLVGISLTQTADSPRERRLVLAACLLALSAITLPAAVRAADAYRRYAVIALLSAALRLWLPLEGVVAWEPTLASALAAAGVIILVLALVPDVSNWWYRRSVWEHQPEQLLRQRPTWPALSAGIIGGAGLVGLAAILSRPAFVPAVAVFLVAIGVLVTAHRRQQPRVGEFGLLLVGEGIVLTARRLLSDHPFAWPAGCAAAGLYLLWLARFWRQQLYNGKAWTTAGTLIPAARRLAHAASVAACACAVGAVRITGAAPALGSVAAGVGLVLLAWMLLRDAKEPQNAFAGWLACLTLLSASVPCYALFCSAGRPVAWPLLFGGLATLLALLCGRQTGPATSRDRACNAYLGGILTIVLYATLLAPGGANPVARAAGPVLLLAAWLVRWSGGGLRRTPAAGS
jgi:hypothetical protein